VLDRFEVDGWFAGCHQVLSVWHVSGTCSV
jgi:hypothetical protein